MIGRRSTRLAGALVAAFFAGLALLPSTVAALGLGAGLGLAGVRFLTTAAARNGALLAAALSLGLAVVEAISGALTPAAVDAGVMKTHTPAEWIPFDPVLGYRPRPDTKVEAVATLGEQTLFRQTYTINATGARATPGTARDGGTYLFIGDSFVFGEGLADDQTLPAQFARESGFSARVVNLGVVGYGPSHLVHALESGLYDSYAARPVKAVVTWIIPSQLARYRLDGDGAPRFTGTFTHHRLANPPAELAYLARQHLKAVALASDRWDERERARLFVALMARLKYLAQERFGAPLVVIYWWPDAVLPDSKDAAQVPTLLAIRELGAPLISVLKLIGNADRSPFVIPHDGHPNALLNGMIARALRARLEP